jgi:hypothetical protein
MSATVPSPNAPPMPAPPQPPLISSSPATQATAAAAGLSAAAIVVIIVWIVGMFHVTVPGEVTAAATSLIGFGVHWLGLKYGLPTEP